MTRFTHHPVDDAKGNAEAIPRRCRPRGMRSGYKETRKSLSFGRSIVKDDDMDKTSGSTPGSHPPHEREVLERDLLSAIKNRRDNLVQLFDKVSGHWSYEDPVYRFYHQSFKVFALQETIRKIVAELQELLPGRGLNPWFREIVEAGTGHQFDVSCNADWLRHTRPILEAFFHARFMLEMAVRYADLEEPPQMLPSGWAALLYLYELR
jgi:hypothetical protein